MLGGVGKPTADLASRHRALGLNSAYYSSFGDALKPVMKDVLGTKAVSPVLVAWTGTPWPDLIVSAAIAALFLHSAWAIVRDARSDLTAG